MRAEATVPADVLARIRAPFQAAGAQLVDPPVIQPLNLFLDLAGEQMRARLFIVQDEGGREACLRPDFTVPVARLHLDDGAAAGRYLYEGKAFRVAPKGVDAAIHPEEFGQIGLEVYGASDPVAEDAQVAAVAFRAARAGGRGDLALRLGDVALVAAFLDAIGVAPATAMKLRRALARPQIIASILKDAQAAPAPSADVGDIGVDAVRALWRDRGLDPVGGRTAEEIADRLRRRAEAASVPRLTASQAAKVEALFAIAAPPMAAIDEIGALAAGPRLDALLGDWRRRCELMVEAGVPADRMILSPGFGRFFGYYDGFLFEIASSALPDDAPVSAGGRYDGLLTQLGGKASSAVGCIVRPSRAWNGAAA